LVFTFDLQNFLWVWILFGHYFWKNLFGFSLVFEWLVTWRVTLNLNPWYILYQNAYCCILISFATNTENLFWMFYLWWSYRLCLKGETMSGFTFWFTDLKVINFPLLLSLHVWCHAVRSESIRGFSKICRLNLSKTLTPFINFYGKKQNAIISLTIIYYCKQTNKTKI